MYRKNRMWRDLVIRFGKKPLILTLALVITITGAVSGSLAWLTATTNVITNTFTIGNIDIDLWETDADGDGDDENNSYEMEIGKDIAKNPTVTVKAGSKACWVFVKIEKSANFDSFLTYGIAEGWEDDLGGGVYYRKVEESSKAQDFPVLLGNKVHVKDTVTKEMLDEISANDNYPYMKIKAYAVQFDGEITELSSAANAWALIPAEEKQLSTATTGSGSSSVADVPAVETANVENSASSEPQNYAERKAQQEEAGRLAFFAAEEE